MKKFNLIIGICILILLSISVTALEKRWYDFEGDCTDAGSDSQDCTLGDGNYNDTSKIENKSLGHFKDTNPTNSANYFIDETDDFTISFWNYFEAYTNPGDTTIFTVGTYGTNFFFYCNAQPDYDRICYIGQTGTDYSQTVTTSYSGSYPGDWPSRGAWPGHSGRSGVSDPART